MAEGLEDLLALSDDRDCAYDRPSIGVSYALWYHGARTHEAVRALAPWVDGAASRCTSSTSGAGRVRPRVQSRCSWPRSPKPVTLRPAEVVIHAADSSPFMVAVATRIFDEVRAFVGQG